MPRPQSENFDTAWASLIQKTLVQGSSGRPAGEGWKSVREFAESCSPKLSASHSSQVLSELCAKGAMERARGKDNAHWSFYYRPIMQTSAKRSAKRVVKL